MGAVSGNPNREEQPERRGIKTVASTDTRLSRDLQEKDAMKKRTQAGRLAVLPAAAAIWRNQARRAG
jgi:hypothetical protein